MADHTPTTDEVRDIYTWDRCVRHGRDDSLDTRHVRADFDRWLAQHDAEVAAKALEEAADEFEAIEQRYAIVHSPVAWLRERADRTKDGAR